MRGMRCKGFTLVEVLVALLIMSAGLLGVGQLLLVGLQTATSALRRTQAIYLLNDMMERIRANPDGRDAYDCASYSPAPRERGCAPSGAPAVICTSRELAEDDLARWQSAANQTLPLVERETCTANVRYFAAADASDVARYEVELSWHDRETEPATLVGVLFVAEGARV